MGPLFSTEVNKELVRLGAPMAIIINSTPGSSTANCYMTLAEADEYLEAHLSASIWADLDDERRAAALISATRELDALIWTGRRVTKEQTLSWPRLYIYDHDSFQVTGVPAKIKAATAELAIWNLSEEDRLAGNFELDTMESVTIGPLTYKIKAGMKGGIPSHIIDIIKSIGPTIMNDSDSPGVKIMVQ